MTLNSRVGSLLGRIFGVKRSSAFKVRRNSRVSASSRYTLHVRGIRIARAAYTRARTRERALSVGASEQRVKGQTTPRAALRAAENSPSSLASSSSRLLPAA